MDRLALRLTLRRLAPVLTVVGAGVLTVGPVVGLLALALSTDIFTVQAVTVIDAREDLVAAVKEVTDEHLRSVPWRRAIFLVPADDIEAAIVTRLPSVRSAHVRRTLPGTLTVIIQAKEPALLLFSGGRYYFVDDQGVAYEEAQLDRLPGVVLPTIKNNDRAATVPAGTAVISEAFANFVRTAQAELPHVSGATPVEIRIPSLASREVHFLLNNNWTVRFDVTRAAATQLAVLRTVLDTTLTTAEKETLEYIDLRIPNRVYYKTRSAGI